MPVGLAALLLLLAGCGGSSSSGNPEDYPVVETTTPEMQPPVTLPNGSVVALPALPKTYEADPGPTCEREDVRYPDGSLRPVAIPPAPGLRAIAVTKHTTRIEWSFEALPDDCRPEMLLLAVVAGTDPRATPTTERDVPVTALTGSKEVRYPDFLPPPDVARASAYTRAGLRSRAVSVLIRRDANTPPDPPDPIPPVTAPAGAPVTCQGKATGVQDPAGDVLTYSTGKAPTHVRKMTPALSGVDITRARVQIDGRTICATFTLAHAPVGQDFQLMFNLHDTTDVYCCASLRFRSTVGRFEVGYFSIDANGSYQVDPVPNSGAALRGASLTITGTLPEPAVWQGRTRRMPETRNLAWSVTTGYYPNKYGPYFGDWLPRYESGLEVRDRDGALVKRGSGG